VNSLNLQDFDEGFDEPTVCPLHARFVPCRRCDTENGEFRFCSDPDVVAAVREYQSSPEASIARVHALALALGVITPEELTSSRGDAADFS
jgi:hypothetical protein